MHPPMAIEPHDSYISLESLSPLFKDSLMMFSILTHKITIIMMIYGTAALIALFTYCLQGSAGPAGPPGQEGARGPTGGQGSVGATGRAGVPGEKGDNGAPGGSGSPGQTGAPVGSAP